MLINSDLCSYLLVIPLFNYAIILNRSLAMFLKNLNFEYRLFFRENFERICKGEELRIPSMDTDLKCRLIHHNDLYLLLGPFRYKKNQLLPC
jgi:hypothetical protein